jgi:nucleotide-binding universal stress UspA family protein
MKIDDVLVPVDFSTNSMRALDFAVSLVEPAGAIYLLHVIDSDFVSRLSDAGFADPDSAITRMRDDAERRLRELVNGRGGSGLEMESMVVIGKPFAEILRVAMDLDFQMIVLGIHGRAGGSLEELLFGSTAEKVLRGARIPVVCVPEM